jgi:Na+/H+ antiporter NhaD/arsenite permease-like protein
MTPDAWIAALVFLVTYVLIASERVHKTIAALSGAVAMILLHVLTQEEAFAAVDFNVIFLLLGMMVIANVMRQTGVFAWVAIRAVGVAGTDPWRILVALCLVTAVASALLDNVTTVVLVGPVTLYLAAALRVSPIPWLIAAILAANIGGAATLIGDPPNILIGSAAGFDFATFAWNMAPIAIVAFVVFLVVVRRLFRPALDAQRAAMQPIDLDPTGVITDPARMRLSVTVMLLTVVGFVVAGPLGYQPATVALLGASALFLVNREDPTEVLARVEWTTLLFFVGLFVVVEGVVKVGIVDAIANWLFDATGGEVAAASLALLWLSGIASGIIDNIPYTATVIPIVQGMEARGVAVEPLWWALAMGASFGGNATLIGASANVVIAQMSGRAGHPISFREFLGPGVMVVLGSLIVSTIYLYARYLI